MDNVFKHHRGLTISWRVFHLSLLEAWRNKMGLMLFFGIPVVFLGIVEITAGNGLISVNLFYAEETYRPILIIRNVCMAFGATGVCAFLSAYYALFMFHRDFDYFRHCVFAGLRPVHFMAGRFGFLVLLITLLAIVTTMLAGSLFSIDRPIDAFIGFSFIGIVYGALGAIIGMLVKDFLIGFLAIAVLSDIDPAWLQNPVYYTAGQNIDVIKWLPAFYPSQYIFSASFMVDNNSLACWGSLLYTAGLLVILFAIIGYRLGNFRRKSIPDFMMKEHVTMKSEERI